ncbi:MAG TPA: hypothetical protein VHC69_05695 [Polyangiaceae bacterium]|nr:hypothetical protein [Polyangiaceae bacterium]
MSHLGDDAEAFFQKGDDGTYDGGPQSLGPVARDAAHESDDLATEVTPELLERRDRFQRIVKTVVGVLGAGVLVLLPFRLGIAGGTSTATAATVVEVATPGAPVAAALAPAETTTMASPRNALNTAPAAAPQHDAPAAAPQHDAVAQSHALPIAKHVTAKPVARGAARTAPMRHTVAHTASNARGVSKTAAPSANRPLHAPSSRRASAVHVPPTASFPD